MRGKVAKPLQIVIDTNVIVAGLRSRNGASRLLLRALISGTKDFQWHLSVPVFTQYKALAARHMDFLEYNLEETAQILASLHDGAQLHNIYYLWRPLLADAEDDMLLELAVAAHATWIVTFNVRHFRGCAQFGIQTILPINLLRMIGDLS